VLEPQRSREIGRKYGPGISRGDRIDDRIASIDRAAIPAATAAGGHDRGPGRVHRGASRGSQRPRAKSVRRIGVVCHPHPLFDGTMQNKVVHTTARAMQEADAPTVPLQFSAAWAGAPARTTPAWARSTTPWPW
jgi:hypothetical protein